MVIATLTIFFLLKFHIFHLYLNDIPRGMSLRSLSKLFFTKVTPTHHHLSRETNKILYCFYLTRNILKMDNNTFKFVMENPADNERGRGESNTRARRWTVDESLLLIEVEQEFINKINLCSNYNEVKEMKDQMCDDHFNQKNLDLF